MQMRRNTSVDQLLQGQQPTGGRKQQMGSSWESQSEDSGVSHGGLREVSMIGSSFWLQKPGYWRGYVLWGKILLISWHGAFCHCKKWCFVTRTTFLSCPHRARKLGHNPVTGSTANTRNNRIGSHTTSSDQYRTEKQTVTISVFWHSSHWGVYFSSISTLSLRTENLFFFLNRT